MPNSLIGQELLNPRIENSQPKLMCKLIVCVTNEPIVPLDTVFSQHFHLSAVRLQTDYAAWQKLSSVQLSSPFSCMLNLVNILFT